MSKSLQVTAQELERYTVEPPDHLAAVAGMMRNLRATHEGVTSDLALAEHNLRAQQARVDQLTLKARAVQDQRTVLTEAWRHLIHAYCTTAAPPSA